MLRDRTKHNGACHYCDYCLHGFKKESLKIHIENCWKQSVQRVLLPTEEEKWVRYTSIEKQLLVPVIAYADFECFTTKIEGARNESASKHAHELHESFGYCLYILYADEKKYQPFLEIYHGEHNIVDRFLTSLYSQYKKKTAKYIYSNRTNHNHRTGKERI